MNSQCLFDLLYSIIKAILHARIQSSKRDGAIERRVTGHGIYAPNQGAGPLKPLPRPEAVEDVKATEVAEVVEVAEVAKAFEVSFYVRPTFGHSMHFRAIQKD